MKKVITIKNYFLGFLLFLINNVSFCQNIPDTALDLSPSRKFIVWQINDKKYGTIIPTDMKVHVDTTGRYILGLTHSGYSSKEEDGTNALLNLSIQLKEPVITLEDQDYLNKQNIIIAPAEISSSKRYSLYISLERDTLEQKRLNQLLSYPKFVSLNSIVPIQIRFNNLSGSTLYDYLTKEDGLKVTLSIDVNLTTHLKSSICINKNRAESWWKKKGGGDQLIIKGGADPLFLDLIKNKVFDDCETGGFDKRFNEKIKAKISTLLVKQSSGKFKIRKKDFFETNWKFELVDKLEAEYPTLQIHLQLGQLLNDNPSYVKDLSSDDQKGLAILKDN